MARLRDNLARLSLEAETVVADAAEWQGGDDSEGFDGILVDAPCASTGTIRRHPDVAWLRQEADIGALMALQKRLLQQGDRAAQAGRNAGLLHLFAGTGGRRAGHFGASRRRARPCAAPRSTPARSPASAKS